MYIIYIYIYIRKEKCHLLPNLSSNFSFSCTNIKNQNINANGKGEYVSLIGVYWFNGNEP